MKTSIILLTALSLAGIICHDNCRADPLPQAPVCQDTTAIRWFLPGQFKDAQAHAEKTGRILMIKGIAFGVDEVGAKCATKGNW